MSSSSRSRFRNTVSAAVIGVLVLVLLPAAAAGSTASVSGGTLSIQGGAENSHLTFGGNADLQEYIVDTAGLTAGAGCSQLEPTEVDCPTDMYTQIAIDAGPGDDYVALGWLIFEGATIHGGAGNDTLYASSQKDAVYGDDGNDDLNGSSDSDSVDGGPGDDRVSGGGGDDQVVGGPGRDSIHGDGADVLDDGNDTIDAVDAEVDQIDCGFGADLVNADAADVVSFGCESVHRPAAPPPPQPNGPAKPTITLSARSRARISAVLKRGYRFTMNCGPATSFRSALVAPAAATRSLHLGRRTVTLAVTAGQIQADTTYNVWLRVRTAKYRRALKRARRVKVNLVISATGSGGTAGKTRHLTFVR
jgi:Ca2+-binding RTX toxin-like protein